jgi:hypothetical protein
MASKWLSWSMGSSWSLWHRPGQRSEHPRRSLCWREIMTQARVCWSNNPPVEQRCVQCEERAGVARIP